MGAGGVAKRISDGEKGTGHSTPCRQAQGLREDSAAKGRTVMHKVNDTEKKTNNFI